MARPVGGYKDSSGKRIPGVTTVIKDDVGGLLHWAWQCGIDGIDYRKVRDTAATAGHLCHDMIEAHILGRLDGPEHKDPLLMTQARKGFDAFLDWWRYASFKIMHTELSLSSDLLRVGGTVDAVAERDGKVYILDWKTSNSVHVEYLLQLAGYGLLWELEEDAPIAGYHILRVGKEHATFHHHYYPADALDDARTAFQYRCKLYQCMKACKKVL